MRSEGYSSRFVCVCVCVCVCECVLFVCPIAILRMAALSIELSHVLCIKSNYLQNGRVVCRKTLSFLRYSQSCSYECFGLHGHAITPIFMFAHTHIIIMPGLNARGLQSKLLITPLSE